MGGLLWDINVLLKDIRGIVSENWLANTRGLKRSEMVNRRPHKFGGYAGKTFSRIEAIDAVPESTLKTIMQSKSPLEAAGIEFIGPPDDGPGIRTPKAEG